MGNASLTDDEEAFERSMSEWWCARISVPPQESNSFVLHGQVVDMTDVMSDGPPLGPPGSNEATERDEDVLLGAGLP